MSTHPEFATNRPDAVPAESVAGAVRGRLDDLVANLKDPPALAVATAYFNLGGFDLVADSVERVGPVRLLLGAEPIEDAVRSTITSLAVRSAHKGDPRVEVAVEQHAAALAEDRDLIGFGPAANARAERLITWLRRGDVEVRRLECGFLHGKAFLVAQPSPFVLAGSSNLTTAGLSRNQELNLGVYTPSTVELVREWFDEQWDLARDYDLAALYEARRVPHVPWEVFLRMLHELYRDTLTEDLKTANELGLTEFQVDGVWRARRILRARRGVVVADEVGLGKTFIAGELIREATIDRRQKVLIVAPATLRDSTWRPFLAKTNLAATVVSFEELVSEIATAGQAGSSLLSLDDYAMVVVDEAHHLRNSTTQRADAVRELLGGRAPKDLVLLTATPVNNSLRDLQTLVTYISPTDAEFVDIGVPSVRAYFDRAMSLDPDELSGDHLFELLDAIAVRRTRRFIKTHYPDAVTGDGSRIVFPQAVVHRVDYDLSGVLPGFFPELATALGGGANFHQIGTGPAERPSGVLTMARYVPSRYRRATSQAEQFQVQNAGLLQSALLKRFESSAAAFASTLRTMITSQETFLDALGHGLVLIGDALAAWANPATDDVVELMAQLDEDSYDQVEASVDYDVDALRAAVEADRDLMRQFADRAERVTADRDPKVAALADALAVIAENAQAEGIGEKDTRNRRKVLVFTYFADTAEYLRAAVDQLVLTDERLVCYRNRVVLVTGKDRRERQAAIVGFAPISAGTGVEEDRYDLAVTTDVLAEGVNLQQAGQIINYDLPWNPMRLVQRHGRVDRIGSSHSHIHLRCFFPYDELEVLLGLEERLQRKLKQAAAAFGTGLVLPGVEAVERVMAETRADIIRLQREDATYFDDQGGAALSSEELQRTLARAFRSDALRARVLSLPWGAGTGVRRPGVTPAVAFCFKVADHARPMFRYVPLERETVAGDTGPGRWVARRTDGVPEVSRQLLVALRTADPGGVDTEGDLPDDLLEAVYDVWPLAQQDAFDEWQTLTDPRTLQPAVPRAMRDAAELVRRHGAALGAAQDDLVERLGQDVEPRILREVRRIVREHEGAPLDAVQELLTLADGVRLSVPRPIEPLPEIELDDIRVVAWVAVHPGDA